MFQGQTVTKPNNLVVDVCSSHQAGMTYVMLSRCCSMQQLHILEQLDPVKISVDEKVREEAARMAAVSLNANPCEWMDPAKVGLRDVLVEFDMITGVPVLFNTSFNLAGDALVHTKEDALATLKDSMLDYVYFVQDNALVK